MENKEIADRYLKWFSKNYEHLKAKYRKLCQENQYDWDEDVFSDTYLKIYESILKKGLNDTTEQGFDNYTFRSFKQNVIREKQYCRVAKRDNNIEDVNAKYEEYYNSNFTSEKSKLLTDLYNDFATLYILTKVEENFQTDESYLFRIKYLLNLTYKEVIEKTNAKKARQKIINVKNWVRENINKKEIDDAFYNNFSELF